MAVQLILNSTADGVIDGRNVRASAFEPARRQLLDSLPRPTSLPATALVVGGGYSRLPRIVSELGYTTTSADPSEESVAIARDRGTGSVTALVAPATGLPLEDESFDLVYCADTLEVTDDADGVLHELHRVTKPGGTVVFDTVTATPVARLIYLVAFQRLPFTRIMPRGRYRGDRLRRPSTLRTACDAVGLTVETVVGFEPASVGALVGSILARRSGRIGDDELAERAGFRLSPPDHEPVVTYFAVARRHD